MTNEEITPVQPEPKPILVGKPYDRVKQFVQIWIPALSTLYFTLGSIWDLPSVTQVIGTLAALATFGGVILGLSSKAYYSSESRFIGDIVVNKKEGGGIQYSLELNADPAEIADRKTVTFKVNSSV